MDQTIATSVPVEPAASVWPGALAGTLLSYLTFYPGLADPESPWLHGQAISGKFNDWHAIGMTLLWWLSERLQMGQGGLLLAHVALVWIGLANLSLLLPPRRRWWLIAAGFSPLIFPLLGDIMKDVTTAGCLTCAYGLLARAQVLHPQTSWRRSSCLGFSFMLFTYALLSRYNALPAIFPGLWWLSVNVLPGRRRRVQGLGFAAMLASALGMVHVANANLVDEYRQPAQQTLIYDLIGMSVRCQENLLPGLLLTGADPLTLQDLQRIYQPFDNITTLWGPAQIKRPRFLSGNGELAEVAAAWRGAIISHPLCYLQHRGELFWFLTGLHSAAYHTYPNPTTNHYKHVPDANYQLRSAYYLPFDPLFNSIWLRPWLTMMLLLACVVALWRRRDTLVFSMVASGLLYVAGLAVLGVAFHFRYVYWPVVCGVTAPLLILGGGYKAGRAAAAPGIVEKFRSSLPPRLRGLKQACALTTEKGSGGERERSLFDNAQSKIRSRFREHLPIYMHTDRGGICDACDLCCASDIARRLPNK